MMLRNQTSSLGLLRCYARLTVILYEREPGVAQLVMVFRRSLTPKGQRSANRQKVAGPNQLRRVPHHQSIFRMHHRAPVQQTSRP